MTNTLTLDRLKALVANDAVAFRVRQKLQPAGGAGDKIFPPTYATGDNRLKYVTETRRVGGAEAVVLLRQAVS